MNFPRFSPPTGQAEPRKLTIQITLPPKDAAWLNQAAAILTGKYGGKRAMLHRIAKDAVGIVAREIVKQGFIAYPPAVTLRTETRAETVERIALAHGQPAPRPLPEVYSQSDLITVAPTAPPPGPKRPAKTKAAAAPEIATQLTMESLLAGIGQGQTRFAAMVELPIDDWLEIARRADAGGMEIAVALAGAVRGMVPSPPALETLNARQLAQLSVDLTARAQACLSHLNRRGAEAVQTADSILN